MAYYRSMVCELTHFETRMKDWRDWQVEAEDR
jgi:hypothetical protein